mmetsp:Transcript_9539/g.13522  ORF Transcript_9539/g.13522 Transcript_9539/m.13522 type:complete len:669 (+) Transcript_9539:125-2131(+)|eukprot:CAMPEP_0184858054 /NCGR_PEP_ID=MMETSP0580-20130426/3168_1 /TAXON_ID=1118495 /ORGANISM="Dactyliosolen fragilissimus" /LENGTH=668 /DNA_ID=CAMNT_0027353973 /DNA_START=165 /DNA_END=2171 /DNA_ORIENTATION=-
MGCINSKKVILDQNDGDEHAFLQRYLQDRILGEGEFGRVRLVYDMMAEKQALIGKNLENGSNEKVNRPESAMETETAPSDYVPFACKILRKGMVWKDNTLYSPIKPSVLAGECNILRELQGKHYNLKLIGIYEGSHSLFLVSEYCGGGEMIPYISTYYGKACDRDGDEAGLRSEDVSRISFQLLDAISHCQKHNVIHRDLKPENIMFLKAQRGSDLRVIDFGSGVMDRLPEGDRNDTHTIYSNVDEKEDTNFPSLMKQADGTALIKHTTFAGTAFYTAPELFQRNYTCKTDIWSVGVVIYVLVAGYPVHVLQTAFNKLHSGKNSTPEERAQDLKSLPNMPPDLPDSFFQMLEMCLTYKQKHRKYAKDILKCDFVNFYHTHEQKLSDSSKETSVSPITANLEEEKSLIYQLRRKGSMLIKGIINNHTAYLKYEKFERSVTTLLATILSKEQLSKLIEEVDNYIDIHHSHHPKEDAFQTDPNQSSIEENKQLRIKRTKRVEEMENKKNLNIIKIIALKQILYDNEFDDVVSMMESLPNASSYDNYAYHVMLLRVFDDKFNEYNSGKKLDVDNSVHRKLRRAMSSSNMRRNSTNKSFFSKSRRSSLDFSGHGNTLDTSNHSGHGPSRQKVYNSVHGNNVWDTISKGKKARLRRAQSAMLIKKDTLNSSSHL